MINPKELRIGNYVRSLKNNSNLCFGGNLPFWEVTIDDMLHILNNPKNYEPITLTEDWLVKFGFEPKPNKWFDMQYASTSGVSILGDESNLISYNVNSNRFSIIDQYEDQTTPVFAGYKVKFVHQLQNLYFALTGQELIYNENHK